MKRRLVFPACVFAAALVLGAGAWALHIAQTQEEALPSVPAASLSGNVVQITYNPSDSDDNVTLVLSDGIWHWAQDAGYPLSQSYAQSMQASVSNVGATALVTETCADFSAYGLTVPWKTISAETDGGEKLSLFIGIRNPHTEDYYLRVGSGSELYTVDDTFVMLFSHTLYELGEPETWPASESERVTSLTFEAADNTYSIALKSEEFSTQDDETDQAGICTFTSGEIHFDTTDAAASSMLDAAGSISFSSIAAFKPDDETLDAFGLKNPTAVLTVTFLSGDSEKTCTLFIGAQDTSGAFYVRTEGSDCICTMDGETVAAFSDFSGSILPEYDTAG